MSKYRVVGYEEAVALGISSDILSSDYCWAIVDDQNQLIGCDGGQPEDQCLVRDWKWVCEALNNEHASQSARIAELEAELAAESIAKVEAENGESFYRDSLNACEKNALLFMNQRDDLRAERDAVRTALIAATVAASVPDQSGQGNHLAPPDPARQPTLCHASQTAMMSAEKAK